MIVQSFRALKNILTYPKTRVDYSIKRKTMDTGIELSNRSGNSLSILNKVRKKRLVIHGYLTVHVNHTINRQGNSLLVTVITSKSQMQLLNLTIFYRKKGNKCSHGKI